MYTLSLLSTHKSTVHVPSTYYSQVRVGSPGCTTATTLLHPAWQHTDQILYVHKTYSIDLRVCCASREQLSCYNASKQIECHVQQLVHVSDTDCFLHQKLHSQCAEVVSGCMPISILHTSVLTSLLCSLLLTIGLCTTKYA